MLAGVGSLVFDLTLPARLPSDADWAEAAATLRARIQPGDGVQLWPAWAERARVFVDAPLWFDEDLARADYVGVSRLWLLSLPRTPWGRLTRAHDALARRGATPLGETLRFGALQLELFDLHAPQLVAELTLLGRPPEEHEVDYVARRCLIVPIGARVEATAAGSMLHVRAGVVGERAYDADQPPVVVQAFADGSALGTLEVSRTEKDGTGWRALDVAIPAGDVKHDFVLAVASTDRARPFCVQAWTTR